MNRFIAIVALLSFAAFGDDPSPVTKTRLGSLHPREGLVVTGVNFSTNNEALVETIKTIGGRATVSDLSASTNYTDYVAQHIRTNENLRSFVKEDGTVYHWITNGIWSTVNLHGNGWDDSYLAGARLYLWDDSGTSKWTWYPRGGPTSGSRTIAAEADVDVLRFHYSDGKTNVFVRGGALMYAENVGDMVSSRFNAASHITTNDVCSIVTNEVEVGFSKWEWDETGKALGWEQPVHDGYYWNVNYNGSPQLANGWTNATEIVFHTTIGGVDYNVTATRERLRENALGLARLKDIDGLPTPQVVTNTIRALSLGGIWDAELQVWWTPRMRNGSLTYEATTNVNLNAGN